MVEILLLKNAYLFIICKQESIDIVHYLNSYKEYYELLKISKNFNNYKEIVDGLPINEESSYLIQ